jgi:hypothetical protein
MGGSIQGCGPDCGQSARCAELELRGPSRAGVKVNETSTRAERASFDETSASWLISLSTTFVKVAKMAKDKKKKDPSKKLAKLAKQEKAAKKSDKKLSKKKVC